MNVDNQYMDDEYDEIDFAELFRKLIKEWRVILKWAVICGVVGLVVAFSIPRQYEASSVSAPERTKSSSGNLGTLASIAGISLANLSTTDAITPELVPSIVNSTPFIVDLFSVPVEFVNNKEVVSTDLYSYFKEYTRAPWWSYVISAPAKAIGWVLGLLKDKGEPVEGYEEIDVFKLTQEQAMIVKRIRKSIEIEIDKKTYIISTDVHAQNPVIAAVLCKSVSENLEKYVNDYHREKATNDLEYYETLYAQSQSEYYEAQEKYANYYDANHGIVLNSRRTEMDRLQNDMNLKYNLYNSCAQQVQQARARVQLETPQFTLISPATTPLKPCKPSKKTIFAGFIFMGAACACVWILTRDSFRSFFRKEE